MTNPLSVEELDILDEDGPACIRMSDWNRLIAAARKGIEAEAIAHGSRSPQSMGFALRDLFPTPGKAEEGKQLSDLAPAVSAAKAEVASWPDWKKPESLKATQDSDLIRQWQRHILLREFGDDGQVLAENLALSDAIDRYLHAKELRETL